ncbi:MAG: DUF5320 domain-containing protein [Bacteroidota bacterium]
MPRNDKTGPQGAGSMTGRHMGLCAGNETQSQEFTGGGLGFGMRKGNRRGFGMGNQAGRFNLSDTNKSIFEKELSDLKNQFNSLAKELLGLKNKRSN